SETSLDQDYKTTIQEVLKLLGKKNLSLIVHGASFPSAEGKNTGIGSPNSEGAKKLVDFAKGIFNSIQLGPGGKTKSVDSSPYTGTIFSNNPLFIDLFELTTDKYSNILSNETFKDITDKNPNKGLNKVAYSYAFNRYQEALREVFQNYGQKLKAKDKNIVKINKEFGKFKKNNESWLEKDSIYEAISFKYQNDYWPLWTDEIDKNLFNPQNSQEKKACLEKVKQIKKEYAEEIEFYCFGQFIAAKQKEEMKEFALKNGIKMIADRQVAFSDRDCWANQSLFLKGWSLGCPPDYFSKDGQAWGFPAMDPEKLFNKNGSLAEGGKLLFALFKKMFRENPGGVRIDHIIGLIDPWVYKNGKKPKPEEGAGRLFSSPEHPELAKYAIAKTEDLNLEYDPDSEFRVKTLDSKQISQYGALIEKIVIAAAKEEGIGKESIICEDLGTLTYPVEKVMEQFDLSGMRLTQFVKPDVPEHPYRGINTEEKSWIMVGTHDNEPISIWADKLINTHEGYLHAKNLADDLVLEEHLKENYIVNLSRDAKALAYAKLLELFTANAQNIQIFFSDFFGIKDVYNKPGTSGDQNWSLRMPDNFAEFYSDQLKSNNIANLARLLKQALEIKGLANNNQDLIKKLDELK
ncbi:MAG: 4-alpha-glucanotransferase, partial [Candidatus Gastranaerophilaceae bacterium]